MNTGAPVVAVVCAYGPKRLTRTVVGDLRRERDLVDIVVVDNGGGYRAVADEKVISPGRNLGWVRGTNAGMEAAAGQGHTAFLLLNNDTRLSPGFVAGLIQARRDTSAELVAPRYDDVANRFQSDEYRGPARGYVAVPEHRDAPFVDGTALLLSAAAHRHHGGLDEDHFGRYGWGAEIDLALRIREGGGAVVVTRAAYCNHLGAASAARRGRWRYREEATRAMVAGLDEVWGDCWRPLTGIDETVTRPLAPPPVARRLVRAALTPAIAGRVRRGRR